MQQVNLYRRGTAAAADSRLFAPRTVLLMLGLVALTLCGITVFGQLRLQRLETQVTSLRDQQSAQTARFEQADLLMSDKTPEQIDTHVESLTRSLAERSAALGALKSGSVGDQLGFSTRFEALARGHIDGLWLVSVSIDSRESAVALAGSAAEPGLVPKYLASLARQPAFAGTRFGHLNIERDEEIGNVRFEVATVAPATAREKGP